MKAAIVVPLDFTAFLCCKHMLRHLKRLGYRTVHVVCAETQGASYIEKIEGWGFQCKVVEMSRHITPIDDIKYFLALRALFKREAYDLVFSTCTKPNLFAPIAARVAGVSAIYAGVWGRGTSFNESSNILTKMLSATLKVLYKLSFSFARKVWFTNPNDLQFFLANNILPDEKTVLTKNYVDSEVFAPTSREEMLSHRRELGFDADDLIVVLSGRMIWSKGIREFIEASVRLKDKKNYKFVLLGAEEPSSPDRVPREFLLKANEHGNFHWFGFVEDVKKFYSICDLAVLPSYYREGGYPRALTEPMAMEKPVIAANTIDCRSAVDVHVNGFLVEPKDSADLAEKITNLLSDADQRREFGRNSRERVLRLYDEKVIIDELYEKIGLGKSDVN